MDVGVTWSAAKTNCSNQGGYLINIDDEAEFNFTKSFFLNSGLPSLWARICFKKRNNYDFINLLNLFLAWVGCNCTW